MDNFNVGKLSLEEESFFLSSSPWPDGLSFVINDSDDAIILPIVQTSLRHQQQAQNHMMFLLQLRQAVVGVCKTSSPIFLFKKFSNNHQTENFGYHISD